MREQKKIELIEQDNGSWFWCILKWSEDNKGWYNSCCDTAVDYETASSEAYKALKDK